MSLTVVTFKWTPRPGYRSKFSPETVNVLRRMVARHYQAPHRFVCVTDDAQGLSPDIEVLPLWTEFADLPSPHGGNNPSCYRRLRLFDPAIAKVLGDRFVSMDLDCVIAGDLRPLWDRPEDFIIWGDTHPRTPYNGSMMLMRAGARAKVWTDFNPTKSPKLALAAGCYGSDQGWISYCLGKGETRWTKADGVYSFRNHIRQRHNAKLPDGARIVFFHGSFDPWTPGVQQMSPWIAEYYH